MLNLVKIYFQGLLDSTAVIKHGRDIKNREKTDSKYDNLNTSYGLLHLLNLLYNEIVKIKIGKLNISFSEIVYAGHTKNNIREFDSFYQWCNCILPDSDKANDLNNISLAKSNGYFKRKDKEIALNVILSVIFFYTFVTKKIELNTTSYLYARDYTKTFITYYRNLKLKGKLLPTLLVISNDHNPKYVAISRVLKLFGVKRIYLQHAGVSNIFPKLDFEYSILLNENSKRIYNNIGKSDSEILTISRRDSAATLERKNYNKEIKIDVCLLPTSIPNIDNTNKVIDTLNKNPMVNKIFIKHHPRFNNMDLIDNRAININDINSIKTERLLFISGNTTATLEFILEGHEVFQCFFLDDITDDYYGFVKSKISKSINLNDLENVFWSESFSSPVEYLKTYCPHLSGQHYDSLERLIKIVNFSISQSCRIDKDNLNTKRIMFKRLNSNIINAIESFNSEEIKQKVLLSQLKAKVITFDEYLLVK